jgi:hypothetical protein
MEPITITYVDIITLYKTISPIDITLDGYISGYIRMSGLTNYNIILKIKHK